MVGFDKVGILAKTGVEIQQSKVAGSEFLFVGKVWEKITRERADPGSREVESAHTQANVTPGNSPTATIYRAVCFLIKLVSLSLCQTL